MPHMYNTLTTEQRGRKIGLREAGLTLKQINFKMKVSISTISDICKSNGITGSIGRKVGSGHKFVYCEVDNNTIYNIKNNDTKISVPKLTKELEYETGKVVSQQTI